MGTIKLAIAGVGNCASNLIQGIEYYRNNPDINLGLMHRIAGGYNVDDIEIAAAFDIAEEKVGHDISEAIFARPNCTKFINSVPCKNVTVQKGPVLDGWIPEFSQFFSLSAERECNVGEVLLNKEVDILVIMIPTGSEEACYFYTREALKSGVSVINGIPTLVSHDPQIIDLAKQNSAAIIGDDFKSQIGGTIFHHTLLNLLLKRGVKIDSSYQINYAGNMDFLNLMTERGESKHRSKSRGIKSGNDSIIDLSVNVSYLENQKDNKTCRVFIEGKNFSGCPVILEGKLTVVDSANSSGVIIDAIRCLKTANDYGIYGYLEAPSAYYMKSPYKQMADEEALGKIEKLLNIKDLLINQ